MAVHRFVAVLVALGCLASPLAAASASADGQATITGVVAKLDSVDDEFVDLSWSPMLTYGSYQVTPYVDGVSQPPQTFADVGSYVQVEELTPGATYTFTVARVDARTGQPELPASAPSNSVTVPPVGASAPGYGYGYTYGTDWVRVHWSTPGYDGGSAITGYSLMPYLHFGSRGALPPPFEVPATTHSALISGVTPGSSYDIAIWAITSGGRAGVELLEPDVTVGPGAPGPARSVRAKQSDWSTATVRWSPPSAAVGPSGETSPPVQSYTVTADRSGAGDVTATVPADRTSATLPGLGASHSWRFSVAATNALGTGPVVAQPSDYIFGSQPPPTITASPRDGSVDLIWKAPYTTGNLTPRSYVLSMGGAGKTVHSSVRAVGRQTIRHLQNGVRYTFTIADGADDSASQSATPRVPTELTGIRATRSGSKIAVRVRLLRADNTQPVAHQKVRLEYRYVGHPDFHVWRTRERTASDGIARFSDVHAVHHVYVRVVAPPAGRFGRSVSRTVTPAV